MAVDPVVILDTIESARFRDGINGFTISRGVTVKGIQWDVGESKALVWAKACNAPGFPLVGDPLHPAYPVVLLFRELKSIKDFGNVVRGELTYGSPPNFTGGTAINYTLTDATQTNHIQVQSTANGSQNLFTVYKVGFDTTLPITPGEAGSRVYHFNAPKIACFRSLRAIGRSTGDQWNAVKGGIREMSGSLNSVPWGSDDRGRWLFLGPITRTSDNGVSYIVQLDFVRGDRYNTFYPLGFYYDRLGIHPKDAATENELAAGLDPTGLPAFGQIERHNGIAIASIYDEESWPTLFSFTPDD